ncbi:hypothetical protein HYN59_04370 [Flavobacterium album]|uniref:Uncharacterized protein n=1 Tax=Flavobacterium album TaxID=2175091 RepID=A0A2S1QVJ5_9FLAO|nr:hypothetical protein HYN59_04370 [Flavobacterium album]
MDIIKIETVNGRKVINGRSLDDILNIFTPNDKEYEVIKSLFIKITSDDDLIQGLKKKKINSLQLKYY